jgi:hypothetical protein
MRWVNEKCVIWEPLAYHFLCTGRLYIVCMHDSFSWNSIDSFRLTSISYTAYT